MAQEDSEKYVSNISAPDTHDAPAPGARGAVLKARRMGRFWLGRRSAGRRMGFCCLWRREDDRYLNRV